MEIRFTRKFERDYRSLSRQIQQRADKQLLFLLDNVSHPSLKVKKMEGHPFIWEGRVSKGYRFTFQIEKHTYLIRRVGTHDILRSP